MKTLSEILNQLGINTNHSTQHPLLALVKDFSHKSGMCVEAITQEECFQNIKTIIEEAEQGLDGQPKSIAMLDTHLSPEPVQVSEKNLVIDAGGTNLRVVRIEHTDGRPEVTYQEKCLMPGTPKTGATDKETFFQTLVEYIKPALLDIEVIKFCFSFPMYYDEQNRPVVKELSKEIVVEGLSGVLIVEELQNCLKKNGYDGIKNVVMLNDTSATLLANQFFHPDHDYYIGVVLGTGFNLSYIEAGSKIINTECGAYSGFNRTEFDAQVDLKSSLPGYGLLEKKMSGKYFGDCFLFSLCLLLEQPAVWDYWRINELVQEELNFIEKLFKSLDHLSTADFSLLIDNFPAFTEKFAFPNTPSKELEILLKGVALEHVKRSSNILATLVAAFTLKSCGVKSSDINPNRVGVDVPGMIKGEIKTCSVNLDGSVINHFPGLKSEFKAKLESLLKHCNINLVLVQTDQSPTYGALIAHC